MLLRHQTALTHPNIRLFSVVGVGRLHFPGTRGCVGKLLGRRGGQVGVDRRRHRRKAKEAGRRLPLHQLKKRKVIILVFCETKKKLVILLAIF